MASPSRSKVKRSRRQTAPSLPIQLLVGAERAIPTLPTDSLSLPKVSHPPLQSKVKEAKKRLKGNNLLQRAIKKPAINQPVF